MPWHTSGSSIMDAIFTAYVIGASLRIDGGFAA